MGLTNRKAEDDTAIKRGPLDENIEVSKPGRYYPEEYSNQINIIQQGNVMKGEIPKALAGIVEHYDDFKISTWADDEETNIAKDGVRGQYDNQIYREKLEFDLVNNNYDKYKMLDSKIDQTVEQAINDGVNVEQAVAEALEEERYQEDFSYSPAAQRKWQDTYSRYALDSLSKARDKDYEIAHLKAGANIQDIISVGTNDVVAGRKSSAESMQAILPKLLDFKGIIPQVEFEQKCNEAYSKLVAMEAIHVEDMFHKGQLSADAATTRLNDLCTNYKQITFDCVDANGNVILDKNGKPEQMTFTLDTQTQAVLWKTFNAAKNGGDINDDLLNTSMDDWHRQVGWDDFQSTGLSNNIKGWSIGMLDSLSKNMLDIVINSNASDKSKVSKAQQVIEETAALRAQLALSELVPVFGSNVGVAFQTALSKLKKDIEGGFTGDWSGYTLGVGYGGKSITIGRAGFLANMPKFGSESLSTRDYWIKYYDQLQKLANQINNTSLPNLVAKLDTDMAGAGTAIVGAINRNTLVEGEGSFAKININGASTLEGQIKEFDRAASKYRLYIPLPDDDIKAVLDNINDTANLSNNDRTIMTRTIARALASTGHLSDIVGYMTRTRDDRASALVSAIALNGSNRYAQEVNSYLSTLVTNESVKEARAKVDNDTSLKSYTLDDLIRSSRLSGDDLNIPASHKMYFTDLSEKVKLVAASKGGGKALYEKMMKSIVNDLYVPKEVIKGLPMSRPFRFSSQMRLYQGDKGEQRLAEIVRTSTTEFKNKMLQFGMDGYKNISVYSDDERGAFTFMVNNKRVKSYLPGIGDTYIGNIVDSEAASKYNAKAIGEYNFQSFVFALGATDEGFRKQFSNASFNISRDEAAKGKPSTFQKIYNPTTRTIKQVYGSDDKKLQTDFVALAKKCSDPRFFEKVLGDVSKQSTNKGAVQNMGPKNEILRVLYGATPEETSPTGVRGGVLLEKDSKYRNTRQQLLKQIYKESGAKGRFLSADMTQNMFDNLAYVGKINQADISIPVTHAAIGNEGYIDAYNTAVMFGFSVTDAYIPGVTNDNYSPVREEEVYGTTIV